MHKTIFIPIEIRSRDYFPRLLIAQFFASKGFVVFFGRKREIELLTKFFTNCFYLGLQTSKTYLPFYQKLKNKNFQIFVYDEEGLVTLNDEIYLSTRVSNEIINTVDHFICWGKKQFNLINNSISNINKKKILNFGNPRIDILKKKYRSLFFNEIKKIEFKNYILINMGFGHANHFLGKKALNKKIKNNNFLTTKRDREIYNKFRKYRKDRFVLFKKTIIKLIKLNPNQMFVIRPHPSENEKEYIHLKKHTNVIVTKEYNVIPWILKSKIVLSDYCSTAIEAKILGVPAISYKIPKNISFLDKSFYNTSIKASSFFKLNQIIKKKKLVKKGSILKLKERLVNIGDNFFSSKKIFNYITRNYCLDKHNNKINKINYFLGKLVISIYLLIFKHSYTEEKCKDISNIYLNKDLNNLSKIEKKKGLNIKKVCQSVFEIKQ